MHHICPKLYMLKCDKNVDFTKDPEVLFEQ